jgi:putative CocE/NonD family hydrolase
MRHTYLNTLVLLCFTAAPALAEDVTIQTRDGATLSATLILPEPLPGKIPAVLVFEVYANPEQQIEDARKIAARGFAGVVALVRGKGASPDIVVPYEHEASDSHALLDWIAKQPWSDGQVGMMGSSYSGFTAWSATKRRHPALKAIAVSAAAIPGQGLPMVNNIFLSANYGWAFYVTNNKTLDETVYSDRQRWSRMTRDWFLSGRPYREIDAIDGTPNPLLQRWLSHPNYDKYWQAMVPYEKEFARIDIPVLSITGYYDDGQVSALEYFKQHVKYARNANHYLVMGPYDHAGTNAHEKPMELRGYSLDASAQVDTQALKLEFLDHALRGAPKPELLADRVNYQVMGANQWRHSPSLEAMHGVPMRLYFSDQKTEGLYSLANRIPPSTSKVVHEVDLADRVKFHNYHAYPGQIVQGPLQYVTESLFLTTPFETATTVTGAFSGELLVTTNKRDFDLGITVFEAMPDGKLFHLGYGMQRASHVESREKRKLLSPGKPERVTFETSLAARQMLPGSRLLVLVDVNKQPMVQINYGTGKDVSDESVKDAGEPLRIEIASGSFIEVPLDNSIPRPAK